MRVEFIGGPYDGQTKEIANPSPRIIVPMVTAAYNQAHSEWLGTSGLGYIWETMDGVPVEGTVNPPPPPFPEAIYEVEAWNHPEGWARFRLARSG